LKNLTSYLSNCSEQIAKNCNNATLVQPNATTVAGKLS